MSSSEKKMITLRSSDGEMFEVEEAVAMESQTIKHMVEDECAKNAIPLPNVSSNNLAKVIEYCKKRVEEGGESGSLKAWADAELMNTDTLYHLMLAANYLNIKSLLDLTCQTAADMMKGKTPQQIREHFKIKNDFSPEEEAKIREENAWAFE